MRRSVPMFLALLAFAVPAGARAQLPGGGNPPGRMGAGMAGSPAEFLLARTGRLQLTDAQVTRLAGIARRAQADRLALRASVDSMRSARRPGAATDSARRAPRARGMMPAMADMQRLQERRHAEFRDAITVLTPDQQATLWEMLSAPRGGAVRAAGFRRMGFPGGAGARGGVVRPRRPFPGGGPSADVNP